MPADGRITLWVVGEDSDPVDMTDIAEQIALIGLQTPPPPRVPASKMVDFARLEASENVRFFVDGKRVRAERGLELISAGVREALVRAVADVPG